jgi:hypothetical protein
MNCDDIDTFDFKARLFESSLTRTPSRDRQGAETACNRRAAWNHRGSRSLTVAALCLLTIVVTMH